MLASMGSEQFETSCREQVAYWQRVLRVQDWKVEIEFWPHKALEDSVAKTLMNVNNKSAVLILRYPEQLSAVEHDWPAGEAADYDLSIVHELLHLHLRPLDSTQLVAEEQACNLIALALIQVYRAQPQGPPTLSPCGSEEAHKASSPGHYM
jgi:hypothetical protein